MIDTGPWSDYAVAAAHARQYARTMEMDVALRRVREYDSYVFVVTLASRNDSDYDRAEIVHPSDPYSQRDLEILSLRRLK